MTGDRSAGRVRSKRRWALYLGSAAIVLVAAVLTALSLLSNQTGNGSSGPDQSSPTKATSASNGPGKAGPLAQFTGSADQATTSFRAAVNWELRWRTEADSQFTVELLNMDGASRGQIVVANKRKEGSVFVSEAGEFKLKVRASRPWSIDVLGTRPAD